ncbi:MAG: Cytochrome c family protein [Labilithrix sp.]|nr:Cytochrome c family protein [Labilithrix sp.]
MTRRTKLVGSLAVLAVAIAMAAMIAVIQRRTAPVTPTENVPTTWETARKVPMHAAHVERGHVACASCHTAGFEEKPTEAACAKCHSDATAHAHHGDAKAPTTCTTCHVFAAGKPEATCVGCHGSTATTATANEPAKAAHALARHVSKEAACSSCHHVHGDKAAKTRTVLGDCTACHTSVKVEHGRVSAGPHPPGGADADPRVCSACHAPHAPAVDARESCATCHVGGKGARAHASDADAHAKGGEILLAGFAPAVEPRGEHVAGHAACVTCHEPHRAEKTDVRKCEDCHADHRSATTTVAGHTACTGCHTPHAPAEAKASCTTAGCHAGKTALAAPRVAAHAKCESCHDPHKPTASPALACVGCHEDLQPKHPGFASKTAGASTCIGCHAPHGGKPLANATSSATASACSTCHTKARTDRGLHAGGVACVACHKPHDFASNLLRTAAGAPAHGTPAPAAKGEEAALCAGCHAPKAAAVAARPGHAECGACHGAAHAPAKRPACVTCHAQETATAPRGHSVCTQCHDSHSGSLGTHALCTSCHAEKPKQQHGALPGAGCATCHTPHGPKGVTTPPACTSCHAKPKLEGLHSVGAHDASCASCHSSHSAPRSDRATCTSSCHLDRRDHQSAAKVCKGCHMFRN